MTFLTSSTNSTKTPSDIPMNTKQKAAQLLAIAGKLLDSDGDTRTASNRYNKMEESLEKLNKAVERTLVDIANLESQGEGDEGFDAVFAQVSKGQKELLKAYDIAKSL